MLSSDSYLTCPKCNQSNTVDFWDRNTKSEEGIKDSQLFVSSGDSKEKHDELQTYYRCPICNEEINGSDLQQS